MFSAFPFSFLFPRFLFVFLNCLDPLLTHRIALSVRVKESWKERAEKILLLLLGFQPFVLWFSSLVLFFQSMQNRPAYFYHCRN